MPDFADWSPVASLFGAPTLTGLVCVDANTTALVKPTQKGAAEEANVFTQGTSHFRVYKSIVHQAGMPAILNSGDFDFGFHDILSVQAL